MSTTDPSGEEEEYGTAELNDRGRLTIPKGLRDDLHLEGGTEFRVIREGSDIRLVRQLPELQTVSSGKSRDEWGDEAFRDAGETTFGGR
ncbi:AbrB/MazE/SpoVT family DNA-binding domain-containing protein [Haloarchaeobius sp. HRN-SO-5]|uniref:AbrB/MazE/SpoVT family DNA-binding domain-containing protein n=1 Tax=Haloarchaeobius sp. HRN-SO-5 TaxID=3446118 RepID=UPI003EB9B0F6